MFQLDFPTENSVCFSLYIYSYIHSFRIMKLENWKKFKQILFYCLDIKEILNS